MSDKKQNPPAEEPKAPDAPDAPEAPDAPDAPEEPKTPDVPEEPKQLATPAPVTGDPEVDEQHEPTVDDEPTEPVVVDGQVVAPQAEVSPNLPEWLAEQKRAASLHDVSAEPDVVVNARVPAPAPVYTYDALLNGFVIAGDSTVYDFNPEKSEFVPRSEPTA